MATVKMLFVFLFLCIGFASAANVIDDEFQCSMKLCGTDLLNFDSFDFSKLVKKIQVAVFCVKQCSPPIVHEFFQSIIYAIRKRIPGQCVGTDCVDMNRFVALGECMQQRSWPMLECSKRLIDLAQMALEPKSKEAARNSTCSIVTETMHCFEENLQKCGSQSFSLVKEILGDVVHIAINAYCHPAYSKQGFFRMYTTGQPTSSVDPDISVAPHVPAKSHYVKAFHDNSAISVSSSTCLLVALVCVALSFYRYR